MSLSCRFVFCRGSGFFGRCFDRCRSFCLRSFCFHSLFAAFADDRNRDDESDFAVKLDADGEIARFLDRIFENDLAAVDRAG